MKFSDALSQNSHGGAFIGMRGDFSKYNGLTSQTPAPQRKKLDLDASKSKKPADKKNADKKKKKDAKSKHDHLPQGLSENPSNKISKDEVEQPIVQKNRSKYLLSLGMVPRGQEHQLEFVKSPFDLIKNIPQSQLNN